MFHQRRLFSRYVPISRVPARRIRSRRIHANKPSYASCFQRVSRKRRCFRRSKADHVRLMHTILFVHTYAACTPVLGITITDHLHDKVWRGFVLHGRVVLKDVKWRVDD
jgi:hypothetical protein